MQPRSTPRAALDEKERTFPIITGYDRAAKPHPLRIPWSLAELAYSVYAGRYGKGQTLERLAERGGFHPGEMDDLLPDWRERASRIAELEAEIKAAHEELGSYPSDGTLSSSIDAEFGRWQSRIHEEIVKATGTEDIDGSGCDSGDPLDFTATEVVIGINLVIDERDEAKAELARRDAIEPAGVVVQLDIDPFGVRSWVVRQKQAVMAIVSSRAEAWAKAAEIAGKGASR